MALDFVSSGLLARSVSVPSNTDAFPFSFSLTTPRGTTSFGSRSGPSFQPAFGAPQPQYAPDMQQNPYSRGQPAYQYNGPPPQANSGGFTGRPYNNGPPTNGGIGLGPPTYPGQSTGPVPGFPPRRPQSSRLSPSPYAVGPGSGGFPQRPQGPGRQQYAPIGQQNSSPYSGGGRNQYQGGRTIPAPKSGRRPRYRLDPSPYAVGPGTHPTISMQQSQQAWHEDDPEPETDSSTPPSQKYNNGGQSFGNNGGSYPPARYPPVRGSGPVGGFNGRPQYNNNGGDFRRGPFQGRTSSNQIQGGVQAEAPVETGLTRSDGPIAPESNPSPAPIILGTDLVYN